MKLNVLGRVMIIGIVLSIQEGQAASFLGRARALVGAGKQLINSPRMFHSSVIVCDQNPATGGTEQEITSAFINEVLSQPDGAPLSEGAVNGFLNWRKIVWPAFSITSESRGYAPEFLRCMHKLFTSLTAHPAQMNAMPKMSILSMLYNAPVEQQEAWITFLLQHGSFQPAEHDVRSVIAQLIADIILLFDLPVDVQAITSDPEFAAEILQSKKSLQKSYAYHIDHPVKDGKEHSLRAWIHEELANERSRVIEKIEQELGASIDTELHTSAKRQALKADGDTAWQKDRKPELTGDREYMKRKVLALGYNLKQPIAVFSGKTFNTAIRYKPFGEWLVVPTNIYCSTFPTAYNNVLSHEMTHYYLDHPAFEYDVAAKFDRAGLSDEQKARCRALLRRFQEKEADILAGLHAGPVACLAFACILEILPHSSERLHVHAPHAPASFRAAALINLSKLIFNEDHHSIPFKQPCVEESPFAKWLSTKCEHPREV